MEDKPGRLWRHSQSEGVKPPANSKPLNPTALWFAIVVQLLLLLQLRIRKSEQLAEMRDLNSVLSLLLTVFTRRLCFFSPTPLWCYRYNLLPFKYISPSEWKLMQQTQNVFYFFFGLSDVINKCKTNTRFLHVKRKKTNTPSFFIGWN